MTAQIHEMKEFRDRQHVFIDRFDSGECLGQMLKEDYGKAANGIILAIPSGGVPVGMKVKEILGWPLDLVIARKLQIPGNPEAGFGAMTLEGTLFYNSTLLKELRLSPAAVDAEKSRVVLELEERNRRFRKGRPFPDLKDQSVILVDDGLASGFTMLACADSVKKAEARETIVAVPTAPKRSIDLVAPEVDHVYCANVKNTRFFAVADAYLNWHDLSQKEVLDLLEQQ